MQKLEYLDQIGKGQPKLVKCSDCAFLEIFGKPERDGYWNKCALLDIYNLEPEIPAVCQYFSPRDEGEELWRRR